MEFIKSWKFMAIIVAVLCVVSIAGVIYGVTTHTEAGFMDERPEWDRGDFPLSVCVESYGMDTITGAGRTIADSLMGADLDNARYVVGLINTRLGFDAYVISTTRCNVRLTYGVPVEANWQDPGGSATIIPRAYGGPGCEAVTSNVHGELRTLTVYHELGHCLGLAHDDFELSIMRRVQVETPDGVIPPWISDYDRGLLRDAFAPE